MRSGEKARSEKCPTNECQLDKVPSKKDPTVGNNVKGSCGREEEDSDTS